MPILNPIDFFELRRKALVQMLEYVKFDEISYAPYGKSLLKEFDQFDADFEERAYFNPKLDAHHLILEVWKESHHNGDISDFRRWKIPLTPDIINEGIRALMPEYRREYLRSIVPDPVEFFNPLVFNQNNP